MAGCSIERGRGTDGIGSDWPLVSIIGRSVCVLSFALVRRLRAGKVKAMVPEREAGSSRGDPAPVDDKKSTRKSEDGAERL
jgi:hypothetical protein